MVARKPSFAIRQSRAPFGVLYVVDENPTYRRMLQMSIESLRRFHPDWPIEVLSLPLPDMSLARRLYRAFSFWKHDDRHRRGGQDSRMFFVKLLSWLDTPFEQTLFLDVDTIVTRSLDEPRRRAAQHDLMLCSLPWKYYEPIAPGQPERIPYQMVGAVFYNRTFLSTYRRYAQELVEPLRSHPMPDQFLVSLICQTEAESLSIAYDPHLQMDVLNASHHFGTDAIESAGPCIDLNTAALAPFHIFHYNELKPQYMAQIEERWGIRGEIPVSEVTP